MKQGGGDGDANQNQNHQKRRFKEAVNQVAPHQPPPPKKCPRCESLNTKFCYYNNYDLAQPRYICKGCRRHWTHGGTLRNVPVGGGHRKGKEGKVSPISCGGESSRSRPPQPPQPPQQPPSQQPPQVDFPNIANMAAFVSGIDNFPASSEGFTISWAHPPTTGSIYPGGIFAAFDGMQMPPSSGQTLGMNRPLRIGGGAGADAGGNMPMFPGFDIPSMQSRQARFQPLQIHDQPRQSDGIGIRNKDKQPMYAPDENMVLPAGNLNSWTPGGNTANASTSSSTFWTNTNGASTSSSLNESSFNPNEWPNIPDYDDAE